MLNGAAHVCVKGRYVLFAQGRRYYVFWDSMPIYLFIGIHILELYLFLICHCFPYSTHNVYVKCFQER